MKNVLYAAMTVAAMTVGGAAQANLVGSDFGFTMFHSIPNFPHTFTGTQTFGTSVPYSDFFGFTMTLDTTTPMAGWDNHIQLDLAGMKYIDFTVPFDGTFTVTGLVEEVDLASIRVLANGVDVGFGISSPTTDSFIVQWDKDVVLAANAPGTPMVDIVWNSVPVPTPGALALLGLSGLTAGRRRRQR